MNKQLITKEHIVMHTINIIFFVHYDNKAVNMV